MSGHSKWSTIKRQKGVADVKRGLTFTKLANAVTMAAKSSGTGSLDDSPRLRFAVDQAREVNMPKENIQRAIDRGLGKLPGQQLEELVYEGFGPERVAVYIEVVSDNRMRTSQEIKNLFDRAGGSLGNPGSVAYMFDKKGEIRVLSKGLNIDSEEQILELIDLGADDVQDYQEEDGLTKFLVYVQSQELNTMSTKITQAGYSIDQAEIVMIPNITVAVTDPEKQQRVENFLNKLEENDDVQKVYDNLEISEEES